MGWNKENIAAVIAALKEGKEQAPIQSMQAPVPAPKSMPPKPNKVADDLQQLESDIAEEQK